MLDEINSTVRLQQKSFSFEKNSKAPINRDHMKIFDAIENANSLMKLLSE